MTTIPKNEEMGDKPMQVSLRVTSRGNALVMKWVRARGSDQYDHPVTMLYMDECRLL